MARTHANILRPDVESLGAIAVNAKGNADDPLEATHALRLRVTLATSAGDVDLDGAVREISLLESGDQHLVDITLVAHERGGVEGMHVALVRSRAQMVCDRASAQDDGVARAALGQNDSAIVRRAPYHGVL